MPEISPEWWTAIGILVTLLFSGIVGKVWKPMRKTVNAVDVLTGRPPRYPGDPEERPGLVERLDRIDTSIAELRNGLNEVRTEVSKIEGGCGE
ncbi:MAG: hypothetical protein IJI68_01925 [Eggerthellaceae bacterium]|nr:hypothetical protein [Eggerthellaceae bacterium]